jgi:membrane peptidoglycan carboxypeptidase
VFTSAARFYPKTKLNILKPDPLKAYVNMKQKKTAKTFSKRLSLIFILLILITLIGILIPTVYVCYSVIRDASTRIERGVIDRIIASESRVYYDDGITPIGVFFDQVHRKHVHYNEIPKVFIKALIAAEDARFFEHCGFDIKAMLRAFISNLKAHEVVQGGSTLTQQTAKNIFKREKRSYEAKLKELIQAFLLERRYSKEEILEMYCNQFFVTGFGKGLKIAAQYFFGKNSKDLSLVEAAFIAGSVKAPNKYNPFIKKTDPEKQRALNLASERKNYVLKRMLQMKFITGKQFREARACEVPFKEGKITYRLNIILDYVRNQLESDYFRALIHEQGIDNVATSGITIHTSINKEVQQAALLSLRTHLPLLEIKIKGYHPNNKNLALQKVTASRMKKTQPGIPFMARISQVDKNIENPRLIVSWNKGGGIIDFHGLRPAGEAWLKWKLGTWAHFNKRNSAEFLANFHPGDTVPVRAVPSINRKNRTKLILSWLPELEGAIVVVHKGMLKAMVGGFSNSFFNRAVDAKRQLGSVFKPIVFTAALNLKWNILDMLQNRRNIFRFENTVYLPRPDHTPQSDIVSMVWAGAKSENLAAVWLLYHLTDRLNLGEFREIMRLTGLERVPNESYQTYKKRLRDQHGVVVDNQALMKASLELSKEQIKTDIIFSGHENILSNLERLQFQKIDPGLKIEEDLKRDILKFNFNRLRQLNNKMKDNYQKIVKLLEESVPNNGYGNGARDTELMTHFLIEHTQENQVKLIYCENKTCLPSPQKPLSLKLEWLRKNYSTLSVKDIWIDDLMTSGIIDLITANNQQNYNRLNTLNPYDIQVLYRVRDFRTLVNLSYVVYLSKKMGISTKLNPVLSFPLGPNPISLMEAAIFYQTIMTGKTYPLGTKTQASMTPVITRIEDRDGEILWQASQTSEKVLSARTSFMINEILGKVMEVGTGRKASGAVQSVLMEPDGEKINIPIPTFGKTGTSNRFTNSSFVGFVPGYDKTKKALGFKDGYVIACYVGYDNNQPMKGKHISIYGASGALPLWIDTANAIVNTPEYKEDFQPANLVFDPRDTLFPTDLRFQKVPVSSLTGLPLTSTKDPARISAACKVMADTQKDGGTWALRRYFEPVKE